MTIKITCNYRERATMDPCGEPAEVLFLSIDDSDWSFSDWLAEAACKKHGPITAHEWGRTGTDWVCVDLTVGKKMDAIRRQIATAGMTSNWDLRKILYGKETPAKTTPLAGVGSRR